MKEINLKDVFGVGVLLFVALFAGWFLGYLYTVFFVLEVLIFFILLYGIYCLYKKWRAKTKMEFKEFLRFIAFRVSLFIVFIIIVSVLFVFYQIRLNPVSTPLYHISNGEKDVFFQTVMHVGSERYYSKIKENLKKAKENGNVLFYEGVKMDDKKAGKKFNKLMGVEFGKDFYENFAKLYGLKHQVVENFLNVVNEKDYNVDAKISNLIGKYEKKFGEIELNGKKEEDGIVDISKILAKRLAKIDDDKLFLVRAVNKAFINFVTKNKYLKQAIVDFMDMQKLIDIILKERNKIIAKRISDSEHEKIFVMYGRLHFEGVLERLKQKDSSRKIVSKKDFYPTR